MLPLRRGALGPVYEGGVRGGFVRSDGGRAGLRGRIKFGGRTWSGTVHSLSLPWTSALRRPASAWALRPAVSVSGVEDPHPRGPGWANPGQLMGYPRPIRARAGLGLLDLGHPLLSLAAQGLTGPQGKEGCGSQHPRPRGLSPGRQHPGSAAPPSHLLEAGLPGSERTQGPAAGGPWARAAVTRSRLELPCPGATPASRTGPLTPRTPAP